MVDGAGSNGLVEGTDRDGHLTVALDLANRVVLVRLRSNEGLRGVGELQVALGAAYSQALVRRVMAAEGTVTPSGDQPHRAKTPTPLMVRPPTSEMLRRGQVRARYRREGRVESPTGRVVGRSRNGCLTVELPPGALRGHVDADPGWLRQSTPTTLAAALTEAYADVYDRREGR